jgi:hypothetical protein
MALPESAYGMGTCDAPGEPHPAGPDEVRYAWTSLLKPHVRPGMVGQYRPKPVPRSGAFDAVAGYTGPCVRLCARHGAAVAAALGDNTTPCD